MKTFSFKLDNEVEQDLETLAKRMKIDKMTVAKKALKLGIRELKKKEEK